MAYRFIICEYNPLHTGHIYHIKKTIENNEDKIICIMSGNCVQRGELAIADKYKRAKWAIQSGADMVIELPTRYILAPAELFALGSIKIIKHFKDKSTLSFGSECGNIDTLIDLANILEDEEFSAELKKNLIRGMSYPKALTGAVQSYCIDNELEDFTSILDNPNNTLGIEYIKAINKLNAKCIPQTILRENNYNNIDIKGNFASASSLRANIQNKELIAKYCPSYVCKDIENLLNNEDKLLPLLKYNLSSTDKWSKICGVSEGIENRIVEKLNTSNSYQELVDTIKSKRYTLARIKRLLLNGLINNTYSYEKLKNEDINFIKVLAVNKNSKDLLSMFNIPIIVSNNDYRLNNLNEDYTDLNMDKLYKSIYGNYTSKLIIL